MCESKADGGHRCNGIRQERTDDLKLIKNKAQDALKHLQSSGAKYSPEVQIQLRAIRAADIGLAGHEEESKRLIDELDTEIAALNAAGQPITATTNPLVRCFPLPPKPKSLKAETAPHDHPATIRITTEEATALAVATHGMNAEKKRAYILGKLLNPVILPQLPPEEYATLAKTTVAEGKAGKVRGDAGGQGTPGRNATTSSAVTGRAIPRTTKLALRLTADEHELLTALAAAHHVTPAKFGHGRVFGHDLRVLDAYYSDKQRQAHSIYMNSPEYVDNMLVLREQFKDSSAWPEETVPEQVAA